jgi:hypothetical protein
VSVDLSREQVGESRELVRAVATQNNQPTGIGGLVDERIAV